MPMQFTPDKQAAHIEVPFFEDASADTAPGYSTRRTVDQLQIDIGAMIVKLGGSFPIFRSGSFGTGPDRRYGFMVEFTYNGSPAVMQVAGLRMRKETPAKREQVQRQALYAVHEILKAQHMQMVYNPGFAPLIQYMLVPGTNQTVGEALMERNAIPNLNPSLPPGTITVEPEVIR